MVIDDGFKALAYPAWNLSDPVSSCQCSLTFKCDNNARQATVLLKCRIPTSRGLQIFVLQYDADKLLPGATSLSRGNTHISQLQLDEILRDKGSSSNVYTLDLSLSQPCPMWCAASPGIAPAPGPEQAFQQLAKLSQATTIHVVFDYRFVQKPYKGMFRAFSKASGGLVGYPVEMILIERGLKKKSWEVFEPRDAVEAPPAYKGPRKRGRHSSSTSPQQSPKRVASRDDLAHNEYDAQFQHSPTNSYNSDKTVALSPATADAIHAALRRSSPAFDFQTDAINAAIARQLPTVVEAALTKALPAALRETLPTLFAARPSSSTPSAPGTPYKSFSSPSSLSSRSRASPPAPLPRLTPLAAALLPHLTSSLTSEFSNRQTAALARFAKLLDSFADAAAGDRAHATAEMMDELEECKAEMLLIRGDALKDVEREMEEVLERGRQQGDDLADELGERLVDLWGDVDTVGRETLGALVRREVQREVGKWRNQRRVASKGVRRRLGKKRARGVLERKRQRTDVEWVDC